MKKSYRWTSSLTALLGFVCFVALARAQEASAPPASAEHKRLTEDVGTWDASIKTWLAGPSSEPLVSKGVEIVKMLPGGFWQISEFHGTVAGAPFHGSGQTGYDAGKGKYICSWVDTMSPQLTLMEGSYDQAAKTFKWTSKSNDPGTGKVMESRLTNTTKGDGTRVFTLEMKSDEAGDDFVKFMEISYTKRPEKQPLESK